MVHGDQSITLHRPVFAGDELRASMEVLEARKSRSRPGLGLVRLRARLSRSQNALGRGLLAVLSRDHLDEDLTVDRPSLEDVYLELTAEQPEPEPAVA